ncbi:hypothetical protein U1Q18_046845 [Sarracenia purpurea var. burkii]
MTQRAVEAQREFHMNKVRARLSRKHNVSSIYDEVLTTVPDVIETRTITTAYTTSSTAMMTTTKTTTTTTTRAPPPTTVTTPSTTTIPSTTPSTTTQTTTTRATTTTTTTTPSPTVAGVVRSTEPNTKMCRANYNGLSQFFNFNRSREKASFATTHSPSVFFTALTKGNHKIMFEEVTEGTTTKRPVFISNAKSRSPKPTVPLPGCVMQKTSLDDGIFIAEGKTIRALTGDFHENLYLPGTYTLPPGVFLFLGFSSIDEQYVRRLVNFEFQECVAGLQEILNKKMAPEVSICERAYAIRLLEG